MKTDEQIQSEISEAVYEITGYELSQEEKKRIIDIFKLEKQADRSIIEKIVLFIFGCSLLAAIISILCMIWWGLSPVGLKTIASAIVLIIITGFMINANR